MNAKAHLISCVCCHQGRIWVITTVIAQGNTFCTNAPSYFCTLKSDWESRTRNGYEGDISMSLSFLHYININSDKRKKPKPTLFWHDKIHFPTILTAHAYKITTRTERYQLMQMLAKLQYQYHQLAVLARQLDAVTTVVYKSRFLKCLQLFCRKTIPCN